MGKLIKGRWRDEWYDTKSSGGEFVREDATFREAIASDGSTPYAPQSGRYHLYVSYACPWAHRTLIFRALKGLAEHVSVSVVNARMGSQGWSFDEAQGATVDRLFQSRFLHQIYTRARPDFTGRVTVPVLWDTETDAIVSNESSEIIRMFNREFNGLTGDRLDFYPSHLREEIDGLNADIYPHVNNGVYKAGFATEQEAYDEAVDALFACLDRLEARLESRPYLCGDRITEADWRLFTTLIRFDLVYYSHFKCNLRQISGYPQLSDYMRALYQFPGVAQTVFLDHIKTHYYWSHTTVNPTRIVPKGPKLELDAPHQRPAPEDSVWRLEA